MNLIDCQDALCIKLKGEIFQPVYSFLTYTYKHPTIHGTQASVCLTRDRDACGWRNRGFCHIWLHCALAWWMTQQENEPDSTRQWLCISFAPYIHKSLIIALCWRCIFLHLSALVSKCRGLLLRNWSSLVSPVRVCMGAISSRKTKTSLFLGFIPFKKDCQGALFHLTHFIFHTYNFSALKFKCWKFHAFPCICRI